MENLRSFMLVTSIQDFCAPGDFSFEPADVEQNPATSEIIVEQGFLLFFKNEADRASAIPVVTSSGSVRDYQVQDFHAAEAASASAQDAPAAAQQAAPQPGTAPSPAPRPAATAGGNTGAAHPKETLIRSDERRVGKECGS